MDREEQFQFIARIMALEYLVKHLLWNQAVAVADMNNGDEHAVVRELTLFSENCKVDLEQSTTSSANPTISDHVAALVSESVQRLVDELVRERGPK